MLRLLEIQFSYFLLMLFGVNLAITAEVVFLCSAGILITAYSTIAFWRAGVHGVETPRR